MKRKFRFLAAIPLLAAPFLTRAQSPARSQSAEAAPVAQSNPAPGTKLDPAKEADIRKLLDVAGTKALVAQTMDAMLKSMKPVLTHSLPPGDYREKLVELFFAKFSAKANPQQLLDMAVPIYDKSFSAEEIKDLIAFYQTPLGQKAIVTVPKITAELQEAGRKWGETAGRDAMLEVLAEHPDLAEALKTASGSQASR
jgi:hypothetical protein